MQKYRTYIEKIEYYKLWRHIFGSHCNKPLGGLWGCRGSEWDDWCRAEDFRKHIGYYEWKLKEGSKVYTIDHENDFLYLVKTYPHLDDNIIFGYDSIDFEKMRDDGYDAVELSREGNNKLHLFIGVSSFNIRNIIALEVSNNKLYHTAIILGLNSWDVPSICVFNPDKTVEVVSGVIT